MLHPWGIKVTRSVIVERRSGGGVIRRDTGWQATSPGLLDYRYSDPTDPAPDPQVADYAFDAGIFKGLDRCTRHPPGTRPAVLEWRRDVRALLLRRRARARGPRRTHPGQRHPRLAADRAERRAREPRRAAGAPPVAGGGRRAGRCLDRLRCQQAAVPRPADRDGRDRRRRRAALRRHGRGVPKLPTTGAWSVVQRPVAVVPPDGGEAVLVSETRGVPIVRRYAVRYPAGDATAFAEPPRDPAVLVGDWRMADPVDLLVPAAPQNEYCLLQSAPTHGFLFPRPYARNSGAARVLSDAAPELAVIIARATSKGAFPPPGNAIRLAAPMPFDVGPGGSMALPGVVSVVNHPTPLRIAGENGHGSLLSYDGSTLELELTADKWRAEFTGLTMWSDIAGLVGATGAKLRIVGSTNQRPQVAEIETLVYEPVERILTYLPIFGARDKLGPIDLGASNAKHEIKIDIATI